MLYMLACSSRAVEVWLEHWAHATQAIRAAPRTLLQLWLLPLVELLLVRKRRKAVVVSASSDRRRTFNGDRPENCCGPRSASGGAAVKRTAMA